MGLNNDSVGYLNDQYSITRRLKGIIEHQSKQKDDEYSISNGTQKRTQAQRLRIQMDDRVWGYTTVRGTEFVFPVLDIAKA